MSLTKTGLGPSQKIYEEMNTNLDEAHGTEAWLQKKKQTNKKKHKGTHNNNRNKTD